MKSILGIFFLVFLSYSQIDTFTVSPYEGKYETFDIKQYMKNVYKKSSKDYEIQHINGVLKVITGITAASITFVDGFEFHSIHKLVPIPGRRISDPTTYVDSIVSYKNYWTRGHTILAILSIGLSISGVFDIAIAKGHLKILYSGIKQ